MSTNDGWLPLPLGSVLQQKYCLEEVLGFGGMAVVLRARHLRLGHTVAVKFVHPKAARTAQTTQRLLREAMAAARLRNPYVVRTLDYDELPDGTPYLVLEHLDGESLASRVKRLGPLEPGLVRVLALQACSALCEAHQEGLLHRDLTPNNLFYTLLPSGEPFLRVLDFGLAKSFTQPNTFETTNPRILLGSPAYMSPEQIRGTLVDARSDIWSLGVVLYFLLTARTPFAGESAADTFVSILTSPPSAFAHAPAIPAPIRAAVARCLRKDPDERYETTSELATALRTAVSNDLPAEETLEFTHEGWRKR